MFTHAVLHAARAGTARKTTTCAAFKLIEPVHGRFEGGAR